jgi:hypothetical protein
VEINIGVLPNGPTHIRVKVKKVRLSLIYTSNVGLINLLSDTISIQNFQSFQIDIFYSSYLDNQVSRNG